MCLFPGSLFIFAVRVTHFIPIFVLSVLQYFPSPHGLKANEDDMMAYTVEQQYFLWKMKVFHEKLASIHLSTTTPN